MEIALAALVLAPGLALGSFMNVVVARVPRGQSVVRPRSACGSCGGEIAWYDNVPLASYLLLRGRCRGCRTRIPLRYPVVEVATAALAAGCVLAFGLTFRAALAAFFCTVLVAVAAIDLEHRIIPNRIVLPATAIVLAGQLVRAPSAEWPVAAAGAFLFFLVAAVVYPSGMGMGDVKLAALIGAALGRFAVVGLFLGMAVALVPAGILLARHGSRARKMGIPLAPFLAAGSVVALFAGDALARTYLALL